VIWIIVKVYIHIMNISSFDLNLLPILEAMIEERNVSRAAKRVGLSQPALSNAIRRMREAFNDPLFLRTSRGMRPTPRAEQLAGPVLAALAHTRLALSAQREFNPATTVQTFRVAMNDYSEWFIASPLVTRICAQSPSLNIQVKRVESLFKVPEAELINGMLDLVIGFCSDPATLGENILSETLSEEDNVVIARQGHPALRRAITKENFAKQDHVAVIYRAEPWGLIDQELAVHGLKRRLRLATPHFHMALQAVANSDMIACVPEGLARQFSQSFGLAVRPLPVALPKFVTRMLWARLWQEDPAHVWLRSQVRLVPATRPHPSS
jgi:DNA-binding transcriptional LysR family regulator